MSKYHRDHKSFVSKVVGVAGVAAAVAYGLKRGGPRIVQALGEVEQSTFAQGFLGRLSQSLGTGTGSYQIFEDQFLSDEAKIFTTGVERLRKTVGTSILGQRRTDQFLEALEPYVVDHEGLMGDSHAVDSLRSHLTQVARADNVNDLSGSFLSHEGVAAFNDHLQSLGYSHRFTNATRQVETFRSIVGGIEAHVSERDIDTVIGRQGSESVLHFLEQARESHRKRFDFLSRQNTPTARNILWRELHKADGEQNPYFRQDVHDAVVRHVQASMGLERDSQQAQKWLQQHINRARVNITNSMEPVQREAWQSFMGSRTGFVLNEQAGQAVSRARTKHVTESFFHRALSEIQIPLIPLKFNVPLKSAFMAMQSTDFVKDLGSLHDNPELLRMVRQGQLQVPNHAGTQLFGLGGTLASIHPEHGLQSLPGTYTMFKMSDSSAIERLVRVRNVQPENYGGSIAAFRQAHHTQSKVAKTLNNAMHLYSQVGYHINPISGESGFFVHPKHPAARVITNTLFGAGYVDPRAIHPRAMMDFLNKSDLSVMHPHDLARAFNIVVNEAGQAHTDISPWLRAYYKEGNRLQGWTGLGDMGSANDVLNHLIQDSANPSHIREHLFRELPRHGGQSILDLTGDLQRNVNPDLYRSLTMMRVAYGSLDVSTKGEGGLLHHVLADMAGHTGISNSVKHLQHGLLGQVMHSEGVARYGGFSAMTEELMNLRELHGSGGTYDELRATSKLLHDLHDKMLVTNEGQFTDMMGMIFTRHGEEDVVNHKILGEMGMLLTPQQELLATAQRLGQQAGMDKAQVRQVQAKMVRVLHDSINNNQLLRTEHKNFMMKGLVDGFEVEHALTDRFHWGRPFHPEDYGPSPLNRSRYMATANTGPVGAEAWASPGRAVGSRLTADNVGNFIAALINPEHAHSAGTMWMHMLMLAPMGVAESAGLGLPIGDQLSPFRTGVGWWLKRTVPLYLGIEAYKNLNQNAHDAHLPGVDDLSANAVANFNLAGAGVKDALGLTPMFKHLVGAMPGLDKYFHPRSRSEYQEYLMYGDEEVRRGRGWLTGSRQELTGGSISHVRPNFFRRWRSHWTEADNVDIANAAHSWLPSPMHPLAPINRLLHPQWFVNKHLSDRPYAPGGLGVGPGQDPGSYLMINSENALGGDMSMGSFGANLPPTLRGAGQGFSLEGGRGGSGPGRGKPGGGVGPGGQLVGSPTFTSSGGQIRLDVHRMVPTSSVQRGGVRDMIVDWVQDVRQQAGLYGAVMQKLPFYPSPSRAFKPQDWKEAISSSRLMFGGQYGEATGVLGEFMRRIVHQDYFNATDYNPLPNNQGSWMPHRFREGDPYTRTPGGEFNVPGDAYERLNPWISPLRVRGSALGLTEQEMIQKWLNPMEPIGDPAMEDIVDFGSRAHLLAQRQLSSFGALVGAEVSVYDPQNNLSGTIDAVVRGKGGALELLDIKTQGGKHWGETPEKYIDQITAYMHMTGIQRAHLVFVNRDHPSETRVESFDYNPHRMQNVLDRVNRARSVMNTLVERGMISPFETYDLLGRIDVLSRIAPESPEFRELVEYAENSSGFGGFEKQRYDQALRRAKRLSEDYNLYPRRSVKTETHSAEIMGITHDGDVVTEHGVFKLAGVKFDPQAFAYNDPEQLLANYGLAVGKKVPITLLEGQWHEELMNDTTLHAIIGKANEKLVKSTYASGDAESRHPLDTRVVHGGGVAGRLWEMLVHQDSMITNKFMRVRTAVEQLERGEIYGTDDASWSDITHTMLIPTLNAVTSKNPLSGAIKGASIAGIFFRSAKIRTKAIQIGAVAGASLAGLRSLGDLFRTGPWKPSRIRQREEFDTYWDTLEFVKASTMAEAAKKHALHEEHVDVDAMEASEKRVRAGLGPWATLAVAMEKKAAATMYGFDEVQGSLQQALQAVPKRHRQLAESVIHTGSLKERQRFYDLISNSERRVLGKFLGMDEESLPDRQALSKYFKKHYLPDTDWQGWREDRDIHDIETVAADRENVQVARPNRTRVERAKAVLEGTPIPRMFARTPHSIRRTLESLMSRGNFSTVKAQYVIRPSHENVVNVNMDLVQDQTQELLAQVRNDRRRR